MRLGAKSAGSAVSLVTSAMSASTMFSEIELRMAGRA